MLTITFGWAVVLYLGIVIGTMDTTGPPWWTVVVVGAVFLAIPLIVAMIGAMLLEFILDRMGFPDRSRFHALHFVPVAALAILPLYAMRGPEIEEFFDPGPPVAIKAAPEQDHPIVDSDSSGFCAPIELIPGDSLYLVVSIRSPQADKGHVRLLVHDQQGREIVAEAEGRLQAGVTRIRMLLGDGSTKLIAWPLRVTNAIVWTPASDGEEKIMDSRSGSLAFLYPERTKPILPAAPKATPAPP
jgi:hypothetical protein